MPHAKPLEPVPIYARWKLRNGKFGVRFIASKSRVAPLKELTIPRLELQGACRLGKTILETFDGIQYLSDSRVALAWIQGPSRSYKPFVSSRIGEIHSNSEQSNWSHWPTKHNVADDITSGITIEEMKFRLLKGPEFLQTEQALWPVETGSPDSIEENKERRRIQIAFSATVSEPIFNCEDLTSWRKLIRVTAYVRRFWQNLRRKLKRVDCDQKGNVGPLNDLDIEDAEEYWLKFAQSVLPQKMQRGYFKTLTPYADENGIIRVGGRVDPSLLSYDNTRPVLLP
ncbi:uncharacterized protein [Montipora foliosa]|uniref:uncharacterized protein n=1 Tax=Montipora foliosa TaxID=591990 RepID=UPI0035F15DC0